MQAFRTPEPLFRARLAVAARVAEAHDRAEPLVAALVVGSTALRRCSTTADLDLVLVTPSSPTGDRFSSQVVEGARVEVERLGRDEALAATAGEGWVWELRDAARLGTGVPVLDTGGFATRLARRAAAMIPAPDRFEATLREVYLLLAHLGRSEGDPAARMDALRGCLDNLALLTLLERPRRYQKPKWALADLEHAGEQGLVDAILTAYRIDPDGDTAAASAAVGGARDLIGRVYALAGLPPHEAILAMGYAPDVAQASYVSRTLDDAEDLRASSRPVEAQYVATFAARLAAGIAAGGSAASSVTDTFAALGGDDLVTRYLAMFGDAGPPSADLLDAALAAADARRDGLEARTAADDRRALPA